MLYYGHDLSRCDSVGAISSFRPQRLFGTSDSHGDIGLRSCDWSLATLLSKRFGRALKDRPLHSRDLRCQSLSCDGHCLRRKQHGKRFSHDVALRVEHRDPRYNAVALDSTGRRYVLDPSALAIHVFATGSNGNVVPLYSISCGGMTQPRGIAVSADGRAFVTDGASNSILIFPPGATGCITGEPKISGANTGLATPYGIALGNGNRIYVTNLTTNTIAEFKSGSQGNVSPVAVIAGPHTHLGAPLGVALDTKRFIYVTNGGNPSITVYRPQAHGDSTPVRLISGSSTGIYSPVGVAVDVAGEIFESENQESTINVFGPDGNGNIAPERSIFGPRTGLGSPLLISLWAPPQPTVTSYALSPNSSPYGITAGPDGNLWFCDEGTNSIDKTTPAGVTTQFSLGSTKIYPARIVSGPDGNLWFTAILGNSIGKITTQGVLTLYPLPNSGSEPIGLAAGADGALWFAERGSSKIGRITTTGVVTEYALPNTGTEPYLMTAGSDGNLWFTEEGRSPPVIGKITLSGVVTEYAVSQVSGGRSNGITTGADGHIWFTVPETNQVGEMGTDGTTLGVFALPLGLANPDEISPGPFGLYATICNIGPSAIVYISYQGLSFGYDQSGCVGPSTEGPDSNMWYTGAYPSSINKFVIPK